MTRLDAADHPTVRGALDWLLCDRTTGRRTVAQWPNLPLILFVVCRLAEILLSGSISSVVHWLGSAFLAWWAADELARGVNPFRRILGAAVLAFLVIGTFAALV